MSKLTAEIAGMCYCIGDCTMGRSQLLASMHNGIAKGVCVVVLDGEIVYAGPIEGAPLTPPTEGKLVLLHADDFQSLKSHVERAPR